MVRSIYARLVILNVVVLVIYFSLKRFYLNDTKDSESFLFNDRLLKEYSNFDGFDYRLYPKNPKFSIPSGNKKIFNNLSLDIFPREDDLNVHDRIYNQMRYVPQNYVKTKSKEKTILLYSGKHQVHFGDFELCPVSNCKLVTDLRTADTADVILWIGDIMAPPHKRPPHQIWALLFHESPMYTPTISSFEKTAKSMINWTVTYRPDSTIPFPYYKYSPYDLVNAPPERYPLPKYNYAFKKTKMAMWMSSNCKPSNNRWKVVKELQKYVQIDTYGACGERKCSRNSSEICLGYLNKDYKFYLAFENSNCRHYITEKFFLNGLSHNVIPIVLGAHPDDYKKAAPPYSYIHVEDFEDLKELGDYMNYLDKNDTAFNEYFAWKDYGTVNFDHHLFCRLCMMAHEGVNVNYFYRNIHEWWHGRNYDMCIGSGKWKKHL